MTEMTWKQRIDLAEEAGKFTEEDCQLARAWTTCAIGEAKDRIGLVGDDGRLPMVPTTMISLGCEFAGVIVRHDIARAREILNEIETKFG